jgi:hypothetical protein
MPQLDAGLRRQQFGHAHQVVSDQIENEVGPIALHLLGHIA